MLFPLVAVHLVLRVKPGNGDYHVMASIPCVADSRLCVLYCHVFDDIPENDEVIPLVVKVFDVGIKDFSVYPP